MSWCGVCRPSVRLSVCQHFPFRSQISDMNEWISFILGIVMTYDRTLVHVMLLFVPIQYGCQYGRLCFFAEGFFPESVLSTEYPELDMLMHEQCLLWAIDAEHLILKFRSKMADRRQIRGFPILYI